LRPLHVMTDAPESVIEGRRGITIQGIEEGAKAAKKRHKQHHQEATTVDNGGINEQADGPSTVHAIEAAGCGKRQARTPTYHFERLLEEVCLNHAYAVKHKLRDCSLMKNFMAIGSLSWGKEVDEAPIKDDATHFPVEDAVMMIFRRQPSPEKRDVLDLSTGTRRGNVRT
jgi:hypothetical protein